MRRLATVLMLGCLAIATAPQADACLRKMPQIAKKKKQVDPTQRDVVAAEKALADGEHAKAAKLARRAIPGLHELPPEDAAPLAKRAQRTLAVAAVRSGGAIDVSDDMRGDTERGKQLNVAWAQLVLTYQTALEQDSVILEVQLAEALALSAFEKDRARDMLRDLSTRDLMPTANGYAMLAKLESDEVLRDAAITRCKDLGGTSCQA